jgi:glutamine amidotransferase
LVRGERIPHVGWNEVIQDKPSPLFDGIPKVVDFYFSHSYHLANRDDADMVGMTPYAGGFAAAVQRGNVYGVQFHPEKSSAWGRRLLRNFLAL